MWNTVDNTYISLCKIVLTHFKVEDELCVSFFPFSISADIYDFTRVQILAWFLKKKLSLLEL